MSPRPPKATAIGASARFKRDRSRNSLKEMLSRADDAEFLRMIWAVDLLQNSAPDIGLKSVRAPNEAVGVTFGDKHFLFKWYLESLANELLTISKERRRDGPFRRLDCTRFDVLARAYNAVHNLKEAESGIYLRNHDIFDEMPRIGHRQFEWQRDPFNIPNFYRAAFLFGQGACRGHFETQYGITPDQLMLLGLGIWIQLGSQPFFTPNNLRVPEIGLTEAVVEKGLNLVSTTIAEARVQALRTRAPADPVAYRPSIYRRTPCLTFQDGVQALTVAPLRELIIRRVTAGLYYDLVAGPDDVRREMGQLFEDYCVRLLPHLFDVPVSGSAKYRFRGNEVDTPDVLVGDNNALKLIVECKATRMSFAARFAPDRADHIRRGMDELAKGVGQIWRLCSHARRGIANLGLADGCIGLILTIDPGMRLTPKQGEDLFAQARDWCAAADPEIVDVDRCPVAFVDIEDLESAGLWTTSDGLFAICQRAAQPEFVGWNLAPMREAVGAPRVGRPYPFSDDVVRLMPWWDRIPDQPV